MPKLISLLQPYEIKSIKNSKEFLILAKNIFRIISKKGCYEKKDGILIPVRWSYKKKNWVVDRGTSLTRDLEGIDNSNINNYYEKDSPIYNAIINILDAVRCNEKFNSIAREINLIKNETKFIPFEFVNKKEIYPLGLFQFIKSKKRKGLLSSSKEISIVHDNSSILLEKVSKTHESFLSLEKLKFKESYSNVYKDFIKYLEITENLEIIATSKTEVINISKEIELNDVFRKDNIDIKHIRNIINEKQIKSATLSNTIKNDIVCIMLCVLLGEFIKKKFNLESAEGFVVYDDLLNTSIKLTGLNILKEKISFKYNKKKEFNNISFLPGVF